MGVLRTGLKCFRRAAIQEPLARRGAQPAAQPNEGWTGSPCSLEPTGQFGKVQVLRGQGCTIEQFGPYEMIRRHLRGFFVGAERAGPVPGVNKTVHQARKS